MDFAGRDITSIPDTICLRFAIHGERHLTIENYVSRNSVVGVVGIVRVWTVLPNERVREAFRVELRFQFADVHAANYTAACAPRPATAR